MTKFIFYIRPLTQDQELAVLPNTLKKAQRVKKNEKKQRNIFQTKKQDKTSGKKPHEMNIIDLPDKKYKVIVIKMLIELGKNR